MSRDLYLILFISYEQGIILLMAQSRPVSSLFHFKYFPETLLVNLVYTSSFYDKYSLSNFMDSLFFNIIKKKKKFRKKFKASL